MTPEAVRGFLQRAGQPAPRHLDLAHPGPRVAVRTPRTPSTKATIVTAPPSTRVIRIDQDLARRERHEAGIDVHRGPAAELQRMDAVGVSEVPP